MILDISVVSRRKTRIALLLPLLFLSITPGGSQGRQEPGNLFPVSTFKLKNGLQVILSEDYSLPLISVAVIYKVGSRNEPENMTGMAHLLENMMFQGSRNVRPMQHIRYIQRLGGLLNARTGRDRTLFYQTVPSNQLAAVLWLESDRMLSLDITPAKVAQARNNILDEIRREKSRPFYEPSLRFDRLLYSDPALHHPVSGYESDIRDIDMTQARRFYETYYRPNNAVLCITGFINKSKTVSLVRKYFETIPQGRDVPPAAVSNNPESEGQTETMGNPLSATPGFFLGYHLPSPDSPDHYPTVLLEYLLFKGKSGRLQRRLLQRERTAVQMNGRVERRAGGSVLRIFVQTTNSYTRERSLKAIQSEINRLRTQLVSEEELEKAKNLFRRDFIRSYATPLDRALFLLTSYLDGRNLNDIKGELAKYLDVSPARIGAIVHRYLNQKRILLNFDNQ